jgi:hypothetical protein
LVPNLQNSGASRFKLIGFTSQIGLFL